MSKKRCVVTGAGGFIGTHTVRELMQKEYDVVAVDIETKKLRKEYLGRDDIAIYDMNILDDDFKHLVEEGDKVLHLAAVSKLAPAQKDPIKAVKVNVAGTLNVVRACLERKAERLVFASTGGVYHKYVPVPITEQAKRDPVSIYGLTKKQAEDWIYLYGKTQNLRYIVLRYGYVYGRGKNWGAIGAFIERIKDGKQPLIFGGGQTNDFIYIKDLVAANLLALESEYLGQTYNIGTGKATSIMETCDLCIEALGSNIKTKIEPARGVDIPMFVYSIERAKLLLKFKPKWSVEEGINDMLKEGCK